MSNSIKKPIVYEFENPNQMIHYRCGVVYDLSKSGGEICVQPEQKKLNDFILSQYVSENLAWVKGEKKRKGEVVDVDGMGRKELLAFILSIDPKKNEKELSAFDTGAIRKMAKEMYNSKGVLQ